MKPSFRVVLPLVGLMACVGDDPVGGAGADAGAPVDATAPQKDGDAPDTSPPSDAGPVEAGPGDSGPTGRCDPTKEFGTPVLMAGLNSGENETGFTMTRDELTAVISRTDPATGNDILLQATRTNIDAPFGSPTDTNVSALNAVQGQETAPSLSPDGLLLYFVRINFGNVIHVATRASSSASFSTSRAVSADGVTIDFANYPKHTSNGRSLYWTENATQFRLRFATIGGDPGQVTGTQTIATFASMNPTLTPDILGLYYGTGTEVRKTDRGSTTAAFAASTFGVPTLSAGGADDQPLHISSDNCVLVLKSNRPGGLGGFDLYMATRPK
jgi:hypothetical protein